jgi:hypothetical protein
MLDVADAAAALPRARLRHNPALPGRLVRLVADEAGALGVELTDAPAAGDGALRPGILAAGRAAARLDGLLDCDATGAGLVMRRHDGLTAPAASRRHAPA